MMASDTISAEVLLLSAGFGTRLKPLTESCPKPLVSVAGKTLIERNLELVAEAGFPRVFINLHHLGHHIKAYVGDGRAWGLDVEYFEEDPILDTGGAIKNIASRWEKETLVTINSDVLIAPTFSLKTFVEKHAHHKDKPTATMLLREDVDAFAYGAVCVNEQMRVCEFLNVKYLQAPSVRPLMYTGIQALSKRVLDFMPKEAGSVFSITKHTYPKMLSGGCFVQGVLWSGYWSDVGTHDRLKEAEKEAERIFGLSN